MLYCATKRRPYPLKSNRGQSVESAVFRRPGPEDALSRLGWLGLAPIAASCVGRLSPRLIPSGASKSWLAELVGAQAYLRKQIRLLERLTVDTGAYFQQLHR